jgi:hypothetical protein
VTQVVKVQVLSWAPNYSISNDQMTITHKVSQNDILCFKLLNI